jgi:hypothetical protein
VALFVVTAPVDRYGIPLTALAIPTQTVADGQFLHHALFTKGHIPVLLLLHQTKHLTID